MTAPVVMEELKSETKELHDRTERREFQRRMVRGELNRAEYVRWLGQMLLVHRALEQHLRPLSEGDARFAAVEPDQFQEPYLLKDLETLGVEVQSVSALPATAALIEEIEQVAEQAPLALLGFHYVLEGSNNGNRFIARKLLPALGLVHGTGDRYLDPYGEEQPAKWARFKQEMNAVGFGREEIDTLVAAAKRMFEAIGDLSDQLAAPASV